MPIDVAFVTVVITMLFVDLFDTSGTLVAVAKEGKLENEAGEIPNLGRALLSDSSATVVGALLGTSSTTSYIESNAGIVAGGKTGLTAVVVALLFLVTLFFAPLASSIPVYATAPALVFVAVSLFGTLKSFDHWDDFSELAPMVITALIIPLSYSIVDGLAAGVLIHSFTRFLFGRGRHMHPIMAILSLLFALRFVFLVG